MAVLTSVLDVSIDKSVGFMAVESLTALVSVVVPEVFVEILLD